MSRRDWLKNDDIKKELGVKSILKNIERGQLRLFGQEKRIEENRYPRKYKWTPLGRRKIGRPKENGKITKTYVKKRGSSLQDIEINKIYENLSK